MGLHFSFRMPYAGDRPGKKAPILVLPTTLDDSGALWTLERAKALEAKPEMVVDFSKVEFARPYGTVLVAAALRKVFRDRDSAGLVTRVSNRGLEELKPAASYLAHVGFFRHIGISLGNAPGARSGSERYLPLTVLTRNELQTDARAGVLQDVIEKRSEHLAALVFEDESKQIMLGYCFREIIRNVFEHAQTDTCLVMAQKYSNDVAELAILDEGVGILDTLSPVHGVRSAKEALKLAIEPGVSRVTGPETESRWDNTGFGLWVTSTLGRRHGAFRITSSNASLSLTPRGEFSRRAPFRGTAIKLRVDTEHAEYFPNILLQIVNEGERLSASKTGLTKKASKSSRTPIAR